MKFFSFKNTALIMCVLLTLSMYSCLDVPPAVEATNTRDPESPYYEIPQPNFGCSVRNVEPYGTYIYYLYWEFQEFEEMDGFLIDFSKNSYTTFTRIIDLDNQPFEDSVYRFFDQVTPSGDVVKQLRIVTSNPWYTPTFRLTGYIKNKKDTLFSIPSLCTLDEYINLRLNFYYPTKFIISQTRGTPITSNIEIQEKVKDQYDFTTVLNESTEFLENPIFERNVTERSDNYQYRFRAYNAYDTLSWVYLTPQ